MQTTPNNNTLSLTPADLFAAAAKGDIEKIALCLKSGIDINSTKYYPNIGMWDSALYSAIDNRQIKTVKFLLDNGVNVNAKDHKNRTALHRAVREQSIDIIELLLKSGPDIHKRQIRHDGFRGSS